MLSQTGLVYLRCITVRAQLNTFFWRFISYLRGEYVPTAMVSFRELIHKKLVYHLLTLFIIVGQAAVLNYFLVTFNAEQDGFAWLGWLAGDICVLIMALVVLGLG